MSASRSPVGARHAESRQVLRRLVYLSAPARAGVPLGLVRLRLELGRRNVAERLEQPRRVEPRDSFQRRDSTSSNPRHGPAQWITSVLYNPITLAAA